MQEKGEIKVKKKTSREVISIIILVVALFSLVVCVMSIFAKSRGQTPSVFGFSIFKMLTGSMVPQYNVDDALIVREVEPETLGAGDVISFYSDDPQIKGIVNTHRIVEVLRAEDGSCEFVTKGDANPANDDYTVKENKVVGKVVGKSNLFSLLIRAVTNRWIFLVVILVPLYFICMISFVEFTKVFAQRDKEKMKLPENAE